MQNRIVYDASQELMQKLAVEAFEVAKVSKAHFTIQLSMEVGTLPMTNFTC